jgi:hypothetical protein
MKNQISIYNVQVYIEMSVNSLMIQNMYSMCEKPKITVNKESYIDRILKSPSIINSQYCGHKPLMNPYSVIYCNKCIKK